MVTVHDTEVGEIEDMAGVYIWSGRCRMKLGMARCLPRFNTKILKQVVVPSLHPDRDGVS